MNALFALLAGLLFGVGLLVSGLANPAKVLGFLDITRLWDPSLAFVMGAPSPLAFSPSAWRNSAPGHCLARRCICPPHSISTSA